MTPATIRARRLAMLAIAVAAVFATSGCETGGEARTSAPVRAREPSRPDEPLPAFLRDLEALLPAGKAVAAIAFVDGGPTTIAFAGGPEVSERTLFEFGSITKVVTANLLAQLVADGTLGLADEVRDHLPRAAAGERWTGVTIRDLATHTSGLPGHPPDWGPLRLLLAGRSRDPFSGYDERRLIGAMRRTRVDPPGERWLYSNYGYAVLGIVVGRVSGSPYADLVAERVLEPTGMVDATLDGWSSDEVAPPLTRRGGRARNWSFDVFAPAGALRGSIRDGLSFLLASMRPCDGSGPVTSAGCAAQQSTGQPLGARSEMGLGWVRTRVDTRAGTSATVVWHNGGTGGYSTFLGHSPETGRGVVVLTNVGRLREIDALSIALVADDSVR